MNYFDFKTSIKENKMNPLYAQIAKKHKEKVMTDWKVNEYI